MAIAYVAAECPMNGDQIGMHESLWDLLVSYTAPRILCTVQKYT